MARIRVGDVVAGRYRVLEVLEVAGSYRAAQLEASGETLRETALRVIEPEFAGDPRAVARFVREARIAATIRSPNVAVVYEVGTTDDGAIFFSTELPRGPSLERHLRDTGALDERTAMVLAAQVADALAEAHGAEPPIVHRKLTPSSIFLESAAGRDVVKVTDFGIARVLGDDPAPISQTGLILGAPEFMAPEQWQGDPATPASDLHALGLILRTMLGGRGPSMETFGRPVPPPLPPSTTPALRELADRLLANDPRERPASALDVSRSFRRILSGARAAPRGDTADLLPTVLELARGLAKADATAGPRPVLRLLTALAVGTALGLAASRWLPPSSGPLPEAPPPTRPPSATPAAPRGPNPTPAVPEVPRLDPGVFKRIEALLAEAAEHARAERWVSPPGSNAVERLHAVLGLSPFEPRAHQALEALREPTLAAAVRARRAGDLERARELFVGSLSIDPDDEALTAAVRAIVSEVDSELDARERRATAARAENARRQSVEAERRQVQAAESAARANEQARRDQRARTIEALRESARAGDSGAQLALGLAHLEGAGVEFDEAVAARWLTEAARGGQVAAMAELGKLHELGLGVPRDLDRALEWYEKAAALGHARAGASAERIRNR